MNIFIWIVAIVGYGFGFAAGWHARGKADRKERDERAQRITHKEKANG